MSGPEALLLPEMCLLFKRPADCRNGVCILQFQAAEEESEADKHLNSAGINGTGALFTCQAAVS